jgi:hypothetical protein
MQEEASSPMTDEETMSMDEPGMEALNEPGVRQFRDFMAQFTE